MPLFLIHPAFNRGLSPIIPKRSYISVKNSVGKAAG
jgi:hypothetical protein